MLGRSLWLPEPEPEKKKNCDFDFDRFSGSGSGKESLMVGGKYPGSGSGPQSLMVSRTRTRILIFELCIIKIEVNVIIYN